ncbi:MAG TPA: nucleotidyl transferase AbiEii/AbiGii toxin family protein [Chitinispirillaceae bacterium]|nr:nucleotidyl transferase AbiEii/AbiGii toxin family protein [Chitinispirillaceae bacterium]
MYIEGSAADTIFSHTKSIVLFDEITLPVVCPEHLIALKLFSASSDPSRKYRDLGDVHEIIRLTNVNIEDILQVL